MSRYLIERGNFQDGLRIPQDEDGATLCRKVIDNNAEDGVTWIQSYVSTRSQAHLLHLRRSNAGSGPGVPRLATACRSRELPRFASSTHISTPGK